jgi:hypothetical protein
VRVNFRESSREHLATTFRRESKILASGYSAIALESTGTVKPLRVGRSCIHVRVNFRESYRERIATTFRRESKSWLAGSLQLLLRAPEL